MMGCRLVDNVPQIVDERSLDIAGGSRAAGSSVRVLAAADRNLQGMSHQAADKHSINPTTSAFIH